MISILDASSYRGFSAELGQSLAAFGRTAQPIFVGRVVWVDGDEPEDVIIKLYEAKSCGVANETIGFVVNALRGVRQPRRGGILVLTKRELPDLNKDLSDFITPGSNLALCWITSYEQDSKPFRYIRRLPSFSDKQSKAFFQSQFCKVLTTVDHVTGNNDRHDGNFLYQDDLKYLAIDQGCVGGGPSWHTTWPDTSPSNKLLSLAQATLTSVQFEDWCSSVVVEYEHAEADWKGILAQVARTLPDLLTVEEIDTIIAYMRKRATGPEFATSCGKII